MASITGGTVRFKKNRKTADFEGHEAEASLNFSSVDDEDAAASGARAAALAQQFVYSAIGEPIPGAPVVEATPAKRTAVKPPKAATAPAPQSAADPAQVVDPAKVQEAVVAQPAVDPADMTDGGVDDVLGASEQVFTDQAMVERVTAHNGSVKNAPAIKALVGVYVGGPPKTVRDIPQDRRKAFLAELERITPNTKPEEITGTWQR